MQQTRSFREYTLPEVNIDLVIDFEGKIKDRSRKLYKGEDNMNISKWIANKLPANIVYFVGIRIWVNATTKQYNEQDACTVTMDDCIIRWERK